MYKTFFGTDFAVSNYANNWFGLPIAKTSVSGTSKNDQMTDIAGGNSLAGGLGDDTYLIADSKSVITEKAGQGVDTVVAYTDFRLSSNVEVLKLQGSLTTGIAADTGSLVISQGNRNVLVSGIGNDILSDETANKQTIFQFDIHSGKDVVYGFSATGAAHDLIKLTDDHFSSFAVVKSAMTQVGADTLLTLSDTDQVLIKNTSVADLTADDFLLSFSPANLKLTFSDDFDSVSLYDANTGQGTWKTSFTHGPASGWGSLAARTLTPNGEKEIYVDPAYFGDPAKSNAALGLNPFSVDNGVLAITASKLSAADSAKLFGYQYSSGLLTTEKTFAQTYGYFEIRAELPVEQGMFPAFWLLPTSHTWPPEIDVFENIGKDFISGGSIAPDSKDAFRTFFPDGLTGFHTYGLLWDAEKITWYIDGNAVGSVPTPDSMHQDMYLLVNLAVGGDWAGDPAADFTSEQLKVDYVHVYSLDEISAGPIQSAVTATLGATDTDLTLVGTAAIDGFGNALANSIIGNEASNRLVGNDGNDVLHGMGGADILDGGAGNDVLDGGADADTMTGGTGDDVYHVDSALDKVIEAAGEGIDTVHTSIDYTLGANIENGVLHDGASKLTGNALANDLSASDVAAKLYGFGGNDTLHGGAGNDLLDGGTGADVMIGGKGDDAYYVDHLQDSVVEAAGEGIDTVYASVNCTLGVNVENGVLQNGATILTGNALDNSLTGHDKGVQLYGMGGNDTLIGGKGIDALYGGEGNDALYGGAGNDTLYGGAGNDVLDGGTGSDVMIGGAGDDVYYTDMWDETIVEDANAGYDTVISLRSSYWMGANIEELILIGTGASSAGGNGLDNKITGSAGSNTIYGQEGNDRISGGAGNDALYGDGGNDWISGDDGNDSLYGSVGNDTLIGGNGNDRIEGQWDDDTLTGGAGADNFVFDWSFGHDVITDFGAGGRDTIDLSTWLKAGIQPIISETSAGTVIEVFGVNSITLLGVHAIDLTQTLTGFAYH